jgi:hypothetical protein
MKKMRAKTRSKVILGLLVSLIACSINPLIGNKTVLEGKAIQISKQQIKAQSELNMALKTLYPKAQIKPVNREIVRTPAPTPALKIVKSKVLLASRSEGVYNIVTVEQLVKMSSIDARSKSGLSVEQIAVILSGTKLAGLEQSFYDAENINNVNALFMIGLAALESGWGRAVSSKNNLFGYACYDSSPESAMRFKSKESCIERVSRDIAKNYLTEEGRYFHGYSIEGMNHSYASDQDWDVKIVKIIGKCLNKVAA